MPARKGPPLPAKIVIEARQLVEKHGLPFRAACQIASGELKLEVCLANLRRKTDIAALRAKEGFDGGLAAQVIDGKLSLDNARMALKKYQYLKENYERSVLKTAESNGVAYVFGIFPNLAETGTVVKDDKFEFDLNSGEEQKRIHKLTLKFMIEEPHWAAAQKQIKTDQPVVALGRTPAEKVLDRYKLRDSHIFEVLENRQVLFITTLAGDLLRGIVDWFSQYEIGMLLKGGVPLTLFRHAIHEVRTKEGRKIGGYREPKSTTE